MEWAVKGALGIIISVMGFYLKRLYDRVDRTERDLVDHRIEDARHYITREEHDNKMNILKNDIRGMISPVRESVQNIEKFLRESHK